MITSQGIQSICALTNLHHLNLELCNRATGLQQMAGEQSEQQCARCLSKDHNQPVQSHLIVQAQHLLHSMESRHNTLSALRTVFLVDAAACPTGLHVRNT